MHAVGEEFWLGIDDLRHVLDSDRVCPCGFDKSVARFDAPTALTKYRMKSREAERDVVLPNIKSW
jgi:hypothetical protein